LGWMAARAPINLAAKSNSMSGAVRVGFLSTAQLSK
jgi:hypothetical protein